MLKNNKMAGISVIKMVKDLCFCIKNEKRKEKRHPLPSFTHKLIDKNGLSDDELFKIAFNVILFKEIGGRSKRIMLPESDVLSHVLYIQSQNNKDRLFESVPLLQTLCPYSDEVFVFLSALSTHSSEPEVNEMCLYIKLNILIVIK